MRLPELQQYLVNEHFTERQSFLLSKMGIFTIEDLLCYFPFRYEDRNHIATLADAILSQETAVVKITVSDHQKIFWNKKSLTKIIVKDHSASAELVAFHIPRLGKMMPIGEEFYIYGKFEFRFNKIQSSGFEFESLEKFGTESSVMGKIVSVYRLTEGMRSKEFRKIFQKGFSQFHGHIIDPIPKYFLEKRNLLSKSETLISLHNPKDFTELEKARVRGAYEEFLCTRISLEQRRRMETKTHKPQKYTKTDMLTQLETMLPFRMTGAQKKIIQEIVIDLKNPYAMHRLVQGDVGSGKTTVALASMLLAAENRLQSVFLVPTEVLAFQHYKKIRLLTEQLKIPCALLTGSMSAKERQPVMDGLAEGSLSILIGTHAVFQEKVLYKNLSLVIIDEQHKFGVKQRSALIQKGKNPDILAMTATPIPRSITLTLYGDLDLSIIDELPAGRQEIETKEIKPQNYGSLLKKLEREIQQGRQIFVVCPLIEESENLQNTKSAEQVFEEYQKYFPQYKLLLIHGRMHQQEKDAVMKEFSLNNAQILIATTVIEVGIDIPNATVMVIENAERFGLAQLHQLRGRVGRGQFKSYCFAVNYGYENDIGLNIFCSTTDGFKIAEADLKLRGPGDLLGTHQTGVPFFRLADFSKDQHILQAAINDSQLIISKDPDLEHHQRLKNFLSMDNNLRVFSG